MQQKCAFCHKQNLNTFAYTIESTNHQTNGDNLFYFFFSFFFVEYCYGLLWPNLRPDYMHKLNTSFTVLLNAQNNQYSCLNWQKILGMSKDTHTHTCAESGPQNPPTSWRLEGSEPGSSLMSCPPHRCCLTPRVKWAKSPRPKAGSPHLHNSPPDSNASSEKIHKTSVITARIIVNISLT